MTKEKKQKRSTRKVKHKEPGHALRHPKADEEVRRRQEDETPEALGRGAPREVSVDLGPIEPEVADVLAMIDDAKGRPPLERELEPADERGEGGAAAHRGRGGRRDERTPEQPGLSRKDRASKQL